MFHDRVLNWSFVASVCANLVLVSLVGGSSLLKNDPVPITRVIERLPFIMMVPPPTPKPSVPKARPSVTHTVTAHTVTQRADPERTARTIARVLRKAQTHPVRVAERATDSPIPRPAGFHLTPPDENDVPSLDIGPDTEPGSDQTGPSSSGKDSTENGKSDASKPQQPDHAGEPDTTTKPLDLPVAKHRPSLADRTEPKELTAWADITASIQYDPQNLIHGVIKVQFDVGATGVPSNVRIIQSCGIAELDQNAVDACRAMRFLPAVQDGVARTITYEHDFAVSG